MTTSTTTAITDNFSSNHCSAPIGIFDSGIGGLTIAQAIHKLMPNEKLVYFGDTYHTPWGDKSRQTIEHYATTICEFLLARHCKAIVVACNTASAVAYEFIKQSVGQRALLINVIDPIIDYLTNAKNLSNNHLHFKNIGLIGTKQTVASASYAKKLAATNRTLSLHALATPLLVPLIEEGFLDKPACKLILAEYLASPILQNIDALILGCTHYPLLKQQIQEFYVNNSKYINNKNKVIQLIDSAEHTAQYLQQLLQQHHLLNTTEPSALSELSKHSELSAHLEQNPPNILSKDLFISDYNPHFVKIAQQFFPKHILSPCNIWQMPEDQQTQEEKVA